MRLFEPLVVSHHAAIHIIIPSHALLERRTDGHRLNTEYAWVARVGIQIDVVSSFSLRVSRLKFVSKMMDIFNVKEKTNVYIISILFLRPSYGVFDRALLPNLLDKYVKTE